MRWRGIMAMRDAQRKLMAGGDQGGRASRDADRQCGIHCGEGV